MTDRDIEELMDHLMDLKVLLLEVMAAAHTAPQFLPADRKRVLTKLRRPPKDA